MNIRLTLAGLLVIAGILLAVAVGAAIVVLIAAGLGALLSSFLPFSIFEATLLALIAALGVAIVIGQIVVAIARVPDRPSPGEDEDDAEEEWLNDWEEDWEDANLESGGWMDEDGDAPDFVPPASFGQEPIRRTDLEKVGRNDPCPCGSGKKFKNCHGRAARVN
jgi:hypothetical protein